MLFDRNVGEYTRNKKYGDKYDPRREGLMRVIYTHDHDLTGKLEFIEDGNVHDPFVWEVNDTTGKMFWTPMAHNKLLKLDKNTKVGWRGPCITLDDSHNLPVNVTYYNTWFDDLVPFRNHIFK